MTNPTLAALAQQLVGGAQAGAAAAGDLIAGYYTPPASGGPPQASQAAAGDTGGGGSPSGLNVIDWRDLAMVSAPAVADGLCTVSFLPVAAGQLWLVDRCAIECTSAADTVCFVYIGDIRPMNLRDSSASGNLDVADNSAPWQVAGSRSLIFQWVGASVGAVATVGIQYRLLG